MDLSGHSTYVETERGGVVVQWSAQHGCYTYVCPWGCFDYDFESRTEALAAFDAHVCDR